MILDFLRWELIVLIGQLNGLTLYCMGFRRDRVGNKKAPLYLNWIDGSSAKRLVASSNLARGTLFFDSRTIKRALSRKIVHFFKNFSFCSG